MNLKEIEDALCCITDTKVHVMDHRSKKHLRDVYDLLIKERARVKKLYSSNKGRLRNYYLKHKKSIKLKVGVYQALNKDKVFKYGKDYQKKHRAIFNMYQHFYRLSHEKN